MRLSFVQQELTIITDAVQGCAISQLLDSESTINNVLKTMEHSSWLHLACHGQQDHSDPLKSGLLLHDGRLELETIITADLSSAKFVFLSACETAMGDTKLGNEGMHLTGGFITAGFHGAIGTLWSMSDSAGPIVAKTVYNKVCERGDGLDVTLAAEGLHLAIQELRKQGLPYHQWMPFVHFGI